MIASMEVDDLQNALNYCKKNSKKYMWVSVSQTGVGDWFVNGFTEKNQEKMEQLAKKYAEEDAKK